MGDQLPDAENAVVPEDKLRGYILSPDHTDGTHKLRVFYSALAIGAEDWEYMREQLLVGVATAPAVAHRPSVGCTLYEVPMDLLGLNGARKPVRTVWKIAHEGGPPAFVTAYVDTRAG